MRLGELVAIAAMAGLTGWMIENIVSKRPRYSALLPAGVAFLPIYAVGGLLVAVMAPRIKDVPLPLRALVYAGSLTFLESAACKLERKEGRVSWDYHGDCIDLPHAAAWGALGLVAERFIG